MGGKIMNFEPIIKTKIDHFKSSYGIEFLPDNEAFERFVNNSIMRFHQPDAFSTSNDLFFKICVGGQNDMGIDGLAIKVNGIIINSKQDVDNIIKSQKKIHIEFIFIQSKYKEKIDTGEYGKFIDGVVDFLSEEHYEPRNDKIDFWIELKEYLFDDEVMIYWDTSPDIRMYYVYMGKWSENEHILAKSQKACLDLAKTKVYNEPAIKYIDSSSLKNMCDDIENQFSVVMRVIDSFDLNEVSNVENSMIILCNAEEIISMLLTQDGIMRKTLFADNVRDYQGNTDINTEIMSTIESSPATFSLLNNGITIVCDSLMPGNRKITMKSPQIVNGCQTCNVLFMAHKNSYDLSNVTVVVKIISTRDNNVTNSIVKGTNRQNIVYDEAFEITRNFHKNLEEFFNVMPGNSEGERYYYERRSKQYLDNPKIKATQKANLRILMQSFVSIFLASPHEGPVHESTLLEKYRNKIFIDEQSFLPYYCAVAMCLEIDKIFRQNMAKYRYSITYKYQILLLASEKITGKVVPDINGKSIDEFCNKLLEVVLNIGRFTKIIDECILDFETICKKWISIKGERYRSAIKDNQEFTKFMTAVSRGGKPENNIELHNTQENLRGKVTTVKKDRNNFNYGFISRHPEDVFFHEDDNPKIRFNDLDGKDVVYKLMENSKFGTPRAKIIYVVAND